MQKRPNNTRAAAYEVLKSKVQAGEFKPRERLTELRVCEMLDIGRTAAREALVRLVVYDDQSGAYMAVRHDRSYGDFSATFRFQSRFGHVGVRLLFRLQDAGTILDYPLWANHQALEVEPDVVLVNYLGYLGRPGQADLRMLRLRVTPSGLRVDP